MADFATTVNRDEVDRLRKRFMKLDKVSCVARIMRICSNILNNLQNANGTIDRDEFLSLPQVSSNPLATRFVAPWASTSKLQTPTYDLRSTYIHGLVPDPTVLC